MPLHRLTDVLYNGGTFPASHDKINDPSSNGDPGVPALADSGKLATSGHVNEGTYFIGWTEDGTSHSGNRPHKALAENTDYLDDICTGDVPVPAELEGTAAGAISSLNISGDVFVGMQGVYTNTQPYRDRLIKVIDNSTGNDMVDNSGVKVSCDRIRNTADTLNAVGVPASGFENNPTVGFTPSIPTGRSYRIVYGKRSTLAAGIRSKTDLDLLLRLAIRASQQASAETIRFITQASRRTGGNIAALSASLIETPRNAIAPGGSILPTANSLNIDIDPTDVGGGAGNGEFNVTFDRAGTPKTLFSVLEGTGDSLWQNTDERISFADVNTLASPDVSVAFSGAIAAEGDDRLRVLEQDATTIGESVSVLKRLNASWAVTVGDGVNTFGDFNGAAAIRDAVVAWNANPVGNGLRILVKPGSYSHISGVVPSFSGEELVVEGAERDTCIIQNGPSNNFVCADCRVVLRNLTFERNGASWEALKLTDCSVFIEDCVFDDQFINLLYGSGAPTTGHSFFMRRCVQTTLSAAAPNTSSISLAIGDIPDTLPPFVVEDCSLTVEQDSAILRLINNTASGSRLVGSILFSRCKLNTAGTANVGGNLAYTTGVLELLPNLLSTVSVGDITYKDCDVLVNGGTGAIGTENVALYLRTGDGTGVMAIEHFKIDGGTWSFGDDDTSIAPFYIGGATWNNRDIDYVTIKNIKIGFTASADYGAAPAEVSWTGAAAGWAACFIGGASKRTIVRDVEWLTHNVDSALGEFFFCRSFLDIDGLYIMNQVSVGNHGPCEYRVRLEPYNILINRASKVRNVCMMGGGTAGETFCTVAGIVVAPWGGNIDLEHCTVSQADAPAGFEIDNYSRGLAYTHQTSFFACSADQITGWGLNWERTAAAEAEFVPTKVHDCHFEDCESGGIRFRETTGSSPPGGGFPGLSIHGNTCKDCDSGPGILVASGDWSTVTNLEGCSICNNICHYNNGSIGVTQIQIGDTGCANGCLMRGIIQGNDCGSAALVRGRIHFTGAAFPAQVMGCETQYNGAGLHPFYAGNRAGALDEDMFHNYARLSF